MIAGNVVGRLLMHRQNLSALIYGATVTALGFLIVFLMLQMFERFRSYQNSEEAQARFERRAQFSGETESAPWPPGSPFLEGQTATVASATLLQQVTGAITRAGGSVVSSEVEAQGAQPKDSYLRVIATGDLEQGALQRVLHDIEAGMPFLFVDQLLVQSSTTPNEGSRLRVRLAISGLWPRTK